MTEVKFQSNIEIEYIQHMGSDEMVAHAAWVSTRGKVIEFKPDDPAKIPGLINYLMKHRHGTPFEHGGLTIRGYGPIFMWIEWLRHRIGFSYNGESGRYKQLDPVFWEPGRDRPLLKAIDSTPARPKSVPMESDEEFYAMLRDKREVCAACYRVYEQDLARGVENGVARSVLPYSIYSAYYVTCNPRSIMALSLRVEDYEAFFVSHPQREIQEAALQLEEIFRQYWPLTHAAFVKNGRVGP